jgi:membrane fusion protein (multidrug efflux system)
VLAKVGGYVDQVLVVENQPVGEREILVALDDTDLRHRVSGAEAELAAARSAVSGDGSTGRANAMVEQARRRQVALEAQLDAARAHAELADADLARMERLASREIVSQQRLDGAKAEATAARAAVQALEAEAAGARAAISDAQGGLRQAEARIQALEAAVAQARLDLSRARITAPTSGLVAKRSVEPGQLVQPGQAVMTVVADTGVYVTANFKETQIADIRVGEAVEMDVDAYSRCTARGEVESLGGATGSQFSLLPADNATGNFTKVVQRIPVRIRVLEGCGSDNPLRPGMSVVAHVTTRGGDS